MWFDKTKATVKKMRLDNNKEFKTSYIVHFAEKIFKISSNP